MSLSIRSTPFLSIRRSALTFENVMLVLLPLSTILSVNLVGRLLVSDFLVVFALFALMNRRKISFTLPYMQMLLVFWLLWCGAAAVSDILNGSSFRNMARGWAKLGLFGVYILVICNLIRADRQKALLAMIGLGIAIILKTDTSNAIGDENGFRTTWKFGLGLGLTLLTAQLLQRLTRSKRITGLGIMLLSPIHLLLGSRSLFLQVVLATGISIFAQPIHNARTRLIASVAFFGILLGGLTFGQTVYDQVVRSGILGEDALLKHAAQTARTDNILLGARSESLIASIAIQDKPLLGHGSWAESAEYRLLYFQLKEARGEYINWEAPFITRSDLIPSHSMLLGAMVEHGVAGGMFWLFGLTIAIRAINAGALGPQSASLIELLAPLMLIWDIFFSPFGATRRCTEAIFLAVCMMMIRSNTPSKDPPS